MRLVEEPQEAKPQEPTEEMEPMEALEICADLVGVEVLATQGLEMVGMAATEVILEAEREAEADLNPVPEGLEALVQTEDVW